jgi:hypothetical protein
MAKAGYRVHGKHISKQTQLNDAGTGIEDVHVVPFTITTGPAAGARLSVSVPHEDFMAGQTQGYIEAHVDATHDVASLGQK